MSATSPVTFRISLVTSRYRASYTYITVPYSTWGMQNKPVVYCEKCDSSTVLYCTCSQWTALLAAWHEYTWTYGHVDIWTYGHVPGCGQGQRQGRHTCTHVLDTSQTTNLEAISSVPISARIDKQFRASKQFSEQRHILLQTRVTLTDFITCTTVKYTHT